MKETKKRIRVRENEDTRKEKNSKNKNLSEICIWRRYKNKYNEEINKNTKIYEKLRRGISQEC